MNRYLRQSRKRILRYVPGAMLPFLSSYTQANEPMLPRIESTTRMTTTLTTGLSEELACVSPDTGSTSTGSTEAPPGYCLQSTLQESLSVRQRLRAELELTATLHYGLNQGLNQGLIQGLNQGPIPGAGLPPSLLGTYSPTGNLKVLGLTLDWHTPLPPLRVRLGRLSRWDSDPLLLDGAELTWRHRAAQPAHRLDFSLYGGLWTALDADTRAHALYGALFPQQVAGIQGSADSQAHTIANESPLVLGTSLRWSSAGAWSLELADTYLLDRHHLRAGAQWMPLPSLTLTAEARSLDVFPRDVRVGLERVQARTGSTTSLQLRHSFEGAFPFSALSHGVHAIGSTRLLIGNPAPASVLSLDLWHPLTGQLLGGFRLGLTQVEATREQAYQRSMLELGLQSYWQPHPRVTGSLELFQVLAPQAGTFVDSGEPVLDDGAGDAFDLNTFPNLSGEGEEAFLEVAAHSRVQLIPALSASAGGGAVWLQQAYTAFVSLQDGLGGRVWLGAQWDPSPRWRADARYLLEQDLNAGLYGWYKTAHQATLSLRARW